MRLRLCPGAYVCLYMFVKIGHRRRFVPQEKTNDMNQQFRGKLSRRFDLKQIHC